MAAHQLWVEAEKAVDRKQWDAAEGAYRRALASDRSHVPSLIGLSSVLSTQGRHAAAHEAIMAAWAQRPGNPALIYALAQRLRFFNEFAALEQCLSDARFTELAPVPVVARGVVMLSSIGAHQAAVRMAQRGVARDPKNAAILYVRGNLHLFSGETEQAEQCYEASLVADPRLYQNSWMLASVRTQTRQANHVDRLRRQLKEANPGKEGEAYLCYALHKELHDLGDYEEAWKALERGCRVKRSHVQYAPGDDARLVDALIERCDRSFVEAASGVRQPAVPIFILGMHRSGTTLLERMLSGHSQVADAGETGSFDAQMQLAANRQYANRLDFEIVERAAGLDYDAVAKGYALAAQWLSRGKPFFTEKLPMNFWNAAFIARALPQARIINLVRDPMDTCFSNLRTLFAGVATYSYVQEELAGFYLQYARLMRHWMEVMPGRILQVSYDDLVADPQAVGRRVAEYCGLSYQASMAEVERESGRVATASAALARQGVRRDRGQVWKHYQAHLRPLAEGLRSLY